MKNATRIAHLLFAGCLALLPANRLFAQSNDPFGADPVPHQPAIVAPYSPLDEIRFDVDLDETSAPEAFQFIAMRVEELGADPLNIVYSKTAEAIVLPTMALRQITFAQFVSFINRIGGSPASSDDPFSAGEGRFMPEHTGPRFGITEADGIWYFWAEQSIDEKRYAFEGNFEDDLVAAGPAGGMPPGLSNPASQKITRVFALEGNAEVTLGLIEEAVKETQSHSQRPEPSLKFHEPSSTLIASGSIEDLEMIDDVIRVMLDRENNKQMQESELLVSEMAEQIKALRQELEFATRMTEEARPLGDRLDREIAVLQAELAEARKTFSAAHPKILALQAELEKALEEQERKK